MKAYKIEIETDNAAFEDDQAGEVARILRDLADRIESLGAVPTDSLIRDINGNQVGAAVHCGHVSIASDVARVLTGGHDIDTELGRKTQNGVADMIRHAIH